MMNNRRGRLSDQVYEGMRERILDELWAEGTRIPAELELSQQYNVSRPVVREALARLKLEGLIDSKRGSGSFVIKPRTGLKSGFRPVETIADIIRVFEFRLSIECDSAAYAAKRRTEEQLLLIEGLSQDLSDQQSDNAFGDADLRFHVAIAEASGNPMYPATVAMMKDQILSGMRLTGVIGSSDASRAGIVHAQHHAIIDAIRCQDSNAAREAMSNHLRSARYRLLGFEVVNEIE
jgi:GntR family transcriptional regulator, transcriptional repressor for pyruvate dehydrogenase complex